MRFEKRFEGKDNAGLRAKIRAAAQGATPGCAIRVKTAIESLAGTVALTASGREKLTLVADDYAANRKDFDTRCDCDSCGRAQSVVTTDRVPELLAACSQYDRGDGCLGIIVRQALADDLNVSAEEVMSICREAEEDAARERERNA